MISYRRQPKRIFAVDKSRRAAKNNFIFCRIDNARSHFGVFLFSFSLSLSLTHTLSLCLFSSRNQAHLHIPIHVRYLTHKLYLFIWSR